VNAAAAALIVASTIAGSVPAADSAGAHDQKEDFFLVVLDSPHIEADTDVMNFGCGAT